MSNVIRPTFGARPKPDAVAVELTAVTEHPMVRRFGEAAGYVVALIHDEDLHVGSVFKVVVGPAGGEVEAVAVLPFTPEGDAMADVVGMAILRTLELTEAVR